MTNPLAPWEAVGKSRPLSAGGMRDQMPSLDSILTANELSGEQVATTGFGYDGVDASALPSGGVIYFYYVDGIYANYGAAANVASANNAVLKGITVIPGSSAASSAQIVDCESGCYSPQEAAAWAASQLAAGLEADCYTGYESDYGLSTVQSAFSSAGVSLSNVNFWVALYDNVAVVPPGCVAKQYQSTNSYDEDICLLSWVSPSKPAPTPTPSNSKASTKIILSS